MSDIKEGKSYIDMLRNMDKSKSFTVPMWIRSRI